MGKSASAGTFPLALTLRLQISGGLWETVMFAPFGLAIDLAGLSFG